MNKKRDENTEIYPPSTLARDGISPYYIGKPKRKKLESVRLKSTTPPPKFIMRSSAEEDEEIVIEEDDCCDITPRKDANNRKTSKNSSLRPFLTKHNSTEESEICEMRLATTGKVCASSVLSKSSFKTSEENDFSVKKTAPKKQFNFGADPNVSRIRDKICEIVDPTGEQRKNPDFLQRMAEKAQKSADLVASEPQKKTKRNPKGASSSITAVYPSFTTACGQDVHKSKFLNPIDSEKRAKMVDLIRQPSPSNPAIPTIGTRKPSVPDLSRKSSSLNGSSLVRKAMEMDTSGGGKDEKLSGLRAEPTLKNFDENIISLIESEIMSVNTEIGWSDVAGLEGAKKALREIVVLPFKRPDVFTGIRAPPKGVLLFGPPGTGKTMIGRCVASQCRATFFNISASSLTSKWVGEGEKLVRALFAVARLKLPSVIFIDEVDSLLSSRSESEHESSRRIKTEFLVQLDGVNTAPDERLLVLGATNRPQELDEAARRRFQKRLYIALPEAQSRTQIVLNLLRDTKNSIDENCLETISELTMGYSGADMRQLCTEAAMGPIRDVGDEIETIAKDDIRAVNVTDFRDAARVVRPTVDDSQLDAYSLWDRKFGCLPPQ